MQTLICSVIILAAAIYTAKRWLPGKLKNRLFGTKPATSGSCGSCSSCGNCASGKGKTE